MKLNSCAPRFYGNAKASNCTRCQCNSNVNEDNLYPCNVHTGKCENCMNNSTGWNCERCLEGFFGDAIIKKNCQSKINSLDKVLVLQLFILECKCDPRGTTHCDPETGECSCKKDFIGKFCEACKVFNILLFRTILYKYINSYCTITNNIL